MVITANPPKFDKWQPLMRRDYYDADNDGAVDTAAGVREVAEFPANPKKGDIVMKDGQLYVCTEVDD